jgi:hypothetical protein
MAAKLEPFQGRRKQKNPDSLTFASGRVRLA